MHFAAERGQAETLQWLVKKNAKVDIADVVSEETLSRDGDREAR
jgi:hypothetical protein